MMLYCSSFFMSLMMLFVLWQHYFKMVDGVVHVYPNKECKWHQSAFGICLISIWVRPCSIKFRLFLFILVVTF